MFRFQPHPIALHWIVTTHGTWLHGDPRGSWHQGKLIGPDPLLHQETRNRMASDAVVLADRECKLVAAIIRSTCEEMNHAIVALTVQPTHLHLVLGAAIREPIKTTVARLKRRTAVGVFKSRRERGESVPRSMWSEGRFVIFLDEEEHVDNTIAYVERHNQQECAE